MKIETIIVKKFLYKQKSKLGGLLMASKKKAMSENLKEEIARELGVYDK